MTPAQIKALRETLPGVTARARIEALAEALEVSTHTVEKWESGDRTPSKQSMRLLAMLAAAKKNDAMGE